MLVARLWSRHFYILRGGGGNYTSMDISGFRIAIVQRQIFLNDPFGLTLIRISYHGSAEVFQERCWQISNNHWVKIIFGIPERLLKYILRSSIHRSWYKTLGHCYLASRSHGIQIRKTYPYQQTVLQHNLLNCWLGTSLIVGAWDVSQFQLRKTNTLYIFL